MLIMKINIVKHYGATLIYCLCVTIVSGSNNLKIFRNVDDTVVEVPSKIEVPIDANLTLICRVENSKIKTIVNGYVAWFILPETHFESKLKALKNSSNLVFRNVNNNDEGLYVCASLNFKIFKTVLLSVNQSKSAKHRFLNFRRLIKRDVIPVNRISVFNYTNQYFDRDFTEIRKEAEKLQEDAWTEYQKEMEKRRVEIYSGNNYDIDFNNKQDSHSNNFLVKPVVLIFGVFFAVFMIFLIIRLCGYMNNSTSRHSRTNAQSNIYNPGVTVPRPNRCGHAACSGNYLLNPGGACRFHHNIIPTAPVLDDGMGISSPLHDTRDPTAQLDLPPTYSSSTYNSTQNLNDATNEFSKKNLDVADSDNMNLPPSYDEAINDNATTSHNYNGGDGSKN